MPKRDDVERLWDPKREIKGKVKAVGDGWSGGALDRVAPGFTGNDSNGEAATFDDGARRPGIRLTSKRISMLC